MNTAETQGVYITPSEVIEYLYCPRFIYFMNCLGIAQHEDQRFMVLKGREVHEQRRCAILTMYGRSLAVWRKTRMYMWSPIVTT